MTLILFIPICRVNAKNIINKYIYNEIILISAGKRTDFFFVVFVVLAILFPAIKSFFLKLWEPKNVYRTKSNSAPLVLRKYTPYNYNEFQKALPSFNEVQFQQKSFDIFKKVQTAWSNFDYDTIRDNVTDEMYNMYKSRLEILKKKNYTNIIKDSSLEYFDIVGMEITKEMLSLTVFMKIEGYNYIINNKGKVVRGNNRKKLVQNYRLTFIKGLDKTVNKCPNCGVPIEHLQSTTCDYCGSVIVGESNDWILSENLLTSQQFKQKKKMDESIDSLMKK